MLENYKTIMSSIIKTIPLYCIHKHELLHYRIQELIDSCGRFGDPDLSYKMNILSNKSEISGYIYSPKYYHTENISMPFVKENKLCRFINLEFRYDDSHYEEVVLNRMRYYKKNILPLISRGNQGSPIPPPVEL
jgi:hypothetical protein